MKLQNDEDLTKIMSILKKFWTFSGLRYSLILKALCHVSPVIIFLSFLLLPDVSRKSSLETVFIYLGVGVITAMEILQEFGREPMEALLKLK